MNGGTEDDVTNEEADVMADKEGEVMADLEADVMADKEGEIMTGLEGEEGEKRTTDRDGQRRSAELREQAGEYLWARSE